MRAATQIALICSALCCSGCRARDRFTLDLGPDDLVVVAVAAGANVRETRAARGRDATALDFEATESLYAFVLQREQLVKTDGTIPSDEELDAIVVTKTKDLPGRHGSCGRCLAPALFAPQVVHQGASCPPPFFAKAQIHHGAEAEAAEPEEIRRQIRLHWPGSCSCNTHVARPGEDMQVCPQLPRGSPLTVDEMVVRNDGTVLAINAGFIWRIDPDGTLMQKRFAPAMRSPQALGDLPGGMGAILGTRPLTPQSSASDFFVVDSLQVRDAAGAPNAKPYEFETYDDHFYILGEEGFGIDFSEPALFRCTADTELRLSCVKETITSLNRCPEIIRSSIFALLDLPSGDAIALSLHGPVLVRPAGTSRWHCDSASNVLRFPFEDRELYVDASLSTAVIDNRVFVCARFVESIGPNELGATSGVFTFSVPPIETDGSGSPTNLPLSYSLIDADLEGDCRRFFHRTEAPGRIYLTLGNGDQALGFDGSGAIVASHDGVGDWDTDHQNPLFPEIEDQVFAIFDTPSGWLVATTTNYGMYRRAPGQPHFVPIYTEPNQPDYAYRALAPGTDYVALFRKNRMPLTLEPLRGTECPALSVSTTSIAGYPAIGALENPRIAIQDSSRSDHFVVAWQNDTRITIATIDFASRSVVGAPIRFMNQDETPIRGGAELLPGRFLFHSDTSIYELIDDVLQPVPVLFDDPTTPEVEEMPDLPGDHIPFRALQTSGGIGWLVGEQLLARITPGRSNEPSRAEAFWLNRLATGDFGSYDRTKPAYFTALSVFCPDDAVMMAHEETSAQLEQPWRLAPETVSCVKETLSLCSYDGYHYNARTAPSNRSYTIAITERDGALTYFFRDGTIQREGAVRAASPFLGIRNAVTIGDQIIFGGLNGRLSAVRDLH